MREQAVVSMALEPAQALALAHFVTQNEQPTGQRYVTKSACVSYCIAV